MVAVIKGDIVGSRKMEDPEKWIFPLKALFQKWGLKPAQWELVWGDFFQIEIEKPEESLLKSLEIKALVKQIAPAGSQKKASDIDVRMAIGLGEKTYSGTRISESNGPAFVYAGERFERLKKDRVNLALQSPWEDFDEETNLNLKLLGLVMDHWTVSSAQLVAKVLQSPMMTQGEIGALLGIKQNSVSGRWNRAKMDELLDVERVFRKKLKQLLV